MHTDIVKKPVFERLPQWAQPYVYLARLDRPIGVWLLLLPGWWAIVLAPGSWGDKVLLCVLFAVGAVFMRAAGCVINDLWDRDLDAKVERTIGRPLASGVVSVRHAFVFLAVLLLGGLAVLLSLNPITIVLGLAVMPLVILYPLMKRFTFWPQAFLGLTFNFGALMGWSAVSGELGLPALLLYVSGLFWTVGYDTVYAHQDKEDDALIGIKSTALRLGSASKIWVSGFYMLSFLFLVAAVLLSGNGGYALPLLAFAGGHLYWQMRVWNMDDHASSLTVFKANRYYGLLVFSALLFM